MPLPHDDTYAPSDETSLAAFVRLPWGDWFHDDDDRAPIDPDIPANQTDDDGTDQ